MQTCLFPRLFFFPRLREPSLAGSRGNNLRAARPAVRRRIVRDAPFRKGTVTVTIPKRASCRGVASFLG